MKTGHSIRENESTLVSDEDSKISMCWNPSVIISLVDLCSAKLVSLDLRGYRDLNDLVLEYVAGATPQNEGKGEQRENV